MTLRAPQAGAPRPAPCARSLAPHTRGTLRPVSDRGHVHPVRETLSTCAVSPRDRVQRPPHRSSSRHAGLCLFSPRPGRSHSQRGWSENAPQNQHCGHRGDPRRTAAPDITPAPRKPVPWRCHSGPRGVRPRAITETPGAPPGLRSVHAAPGPHLWGSAAAAVGGPQQDALSRGH